MNERERVAGSMPPLSRPIVYAGVGLVLVLVALYVVRGYFYPRSAANDASASAEVFEKTRTIEVTDHDFKPKTAAVKFGDKVTWKNSGTQSHTVTFRFLSKTLYPGEEWSWTIARDVFTEGENLYRCELHGDKGAKGASLVVAE